MKPELCLQQRLILSPCLAFLGQGICLSDVLAARKQLPGLLRGGCDGFLALCRRRGEAVSVWRAWPAGTEPATATPGPRDF